MNSKNEICSPSFSAIPVITTFADAPTSDPLPPKHAPNAKENDSASKSNPKSAYDSCSTTGTIVAVYGMLSKNADTTADTNVSRHTANI